MKITEKEELCLPSEGSSNGVVGSPTDLFVVEQSF
jgi:hypothetical protein